MVRTTSTSNYHSSTSNTFCTIYLFIFNLLPISVQSHRVKGLLSFVRRVWFRGAALHKVLILGHLSTSCWRLTGNGLGESGSESIVAPRWVYCRSLLMVMVVVYRLGHPADTTVLWLGYPTAGTGCSEHPCWRVYNTTPPIDKNMCE